MVDVEKVRNWLIPQLENNQKSVEAILRTHTPQALTTFRDGGTGWTALEALCHLRDVDALFTLRAHLTVEQDNPQLPFPDPGVVAVEQQYNLQDFEAVLAAWKSNRAAIFAYWNERPLSDWDRIATHPTRGLLSLFDQMILLPVHDSLHIEQITRILYEKKLGE